VLAVPAILFQFDPAEVGSLVSATYSAPADSVWVYGSSNANIHQYSRTGAFLGSVPRPGEAADDFDIIGTSSADYTINFGDLEVHPVNGNLLLVSSDETTIRELTPTGVFVSDYALPAGVSSLSGIGVDAGRGEVWVSGTSGNVWRIGEVPEPGTMLLAAGGLAALARRGARRSRQVR
jgi:hypothetical protein